MWKIHDEWIDLTLARHVVIFKNHQTSAEHQLIHEFGVPACPHCGHIKIDENQIPIDFEQYKNEEMDKLIAHHKQVIEYKGKHPNVRLGNGPK